MEINIYIKHSKSDVNVSIFSHLSRLSRGFLRPSSFADGVSDGGPVDWLPQAMFELHSQLVNTVLVTYYS